MLLAASAGRKPVSGEAQMREVFTANPHFGVVSFGIAEKLLANPFRFFFSQQHSVATDLTVGWITLGSPSPLGRGSMVHRLAIESVPEFAQLPWAKHPAVARCSLSLRALPLS